MMIFFYNICSDLKVVILFLKYPIDIDYGCIIEKCRKYNVKYEN